MKLQDAIQLLQSRETVFPGRQTWADLGCGNGTFTKALAHLLDPGSIIYAVDRNKVSLNEIPDEYNGQVLKKMKGDFIIDQLDFENLDGMLLANSLHFVSDKTRFIQNITKYLTSHHSFLVVEYDTDRANRWVPYPISFHSLEILFSKAGYDKISKLNERSSIYQNGNIYSALIRKRQLL